MTSMHRQCHRTEDKYSHILYRDHIYHQHHPSRPHDLVSPDLPKEEKPISSNLHNSAERFIGSVTNSIQIFGWFLSYTHFLHQNIMDLEFSFSTVICCCCCCCCSRCCFVVKTWISDIIKEMESKNKSKEWCRLRIYLWMTNMTGTVYF